MFCSCQNEADTIGLIQEIIALPDAITSLFLESTSVIWAGTPFPGIRAFCTGSVNNNETQAFQIDFAFHEPILLEPRATGIPEVGLFLSSAPETLFAWKLHGLVEFGIVRWRAKDILWHGTNLNLEH